jgi:hypothetical protein
VIRPLMSLLVACSEPSIAPDQNGSLPSGYYYEDAFAQAVTQQGFSLMEEWQLGANGVYFSGDNAVISWRLSHEDRTCEARVSGSRLHLKCDRDEFVAKWVVIEDKVETDLLQVVSGNKKAPTSLVNLHRPFSDLINETVVISEAQTKGSGNPQIVLQGDKLTFKSEEFEVNKRPCKAGSGSHYVATRCLMLWEPVPTPRGFAYSDGAWLLGQVPDEMQPNTLTIQVPIQRYDLRVE